MNRMDLTPNESTKLARVCHFQHSYDIIRSSYKVS